MIKNIRLRIAIQKNGRLNHDSMDLLTRCGLKLRISPNSLLCHVENLPIDLLFVRDDDIPTLIRDGVCDIGIVGENVLYEQEQQQDVIDEVSLLIGKKLGFCRCRLAIAVPQNYSYQDLQSLKGLRIATSYPNLLKKYLRQHQLEAEIMTISGSVEIAPKLGMADAICDLVSTGRTLQEHHLREVERVIESEAVLIHSRATFVPEKQGVYELLLRRIESVLKADESKYIMFHAPKSALSQIKVILPGCESPTIMPLEGSKERVAVHVVSGEKIFWDTLEKLKQIGASSILVLPIEKMLN